MTSKTWANKLNIDPRHREFMQARYEKGRKPGQAWKVLIEPALLDEMSNSFVCLSHLLYSAHFGPRDTQAVIAERDDPDGLRPERLGFFTNPWGIPAQGWHFDESDPRYARKNTPPSQRPAMGPFWVFTLEHDPKTSDDFDLTSQLDWITDEAEDGTTLLDRVDAAFSKYIEYRGYEVVFSGNKSLHLHFYFSTYHMNRQVLLSHYERIGKKPEAALRKYFHGDLAPDAITEYYGAKWGEVAAMFHHVMGRTVEFDSAMKRPYGYRRLGGGTREVKKTDIHRFREGGRVPQLILAERIRKTAPRGATETFLSTKEGNEAIYKRNPPRPNKGASTKLNDPELSALLPLLESYLQESWEVEYPRPVRISWVSDVVQVNLQNSESDRNPSSVIQSDFGRIEYLGRDIPADPKLWRLPHGETLGELLDVLADQKVGPGPQQAPSRGRTIYGRTGKLVDRMATSGGLKNEARNSIANAMSLAVLSDHPQCIVAPEGVGKSWFLKSRTIDRHLDALAEALDPECATEGSRLNDPSSSFAVFASRSRAQAAQHYQEHLESGGSAVLLESFTARYEGYCERNKRDSISLVQAAQLGYSSQFDAIIAEQPDILAAISEEKNLAWRSRDGRDLFRSRVGAPVFATHRMAQSFHHETRARAWLHPEFHAGMRPDERAELTRDFRAWEIVHDEVFIEDILSIAERDEVEFAARVAVRVGCDWDQMKLPEKYQAYYAEAARYQKPPGFERTNDLIQMNFGTSDEVIVKHAAAPFGKDRNDRGIYKERDGKGIYIRPQSWWIDQRARTVMLTTERLPAAILESISKNDRTNAVNVRYWDDPEAFPNPSVPLIRSELASSGPDSKAGGKKIQKLADQCVHEGYHVIADVARGEKITTFQSARGRNDLKNSNIVSIYGYLSPTVYARLNAVAQRFSISNIYQIYYSDMWNQAIGRNQGFRSDPVNPVEHIVIMNPSLYTELGSETFRTGRYPLYLHEA